MERGTYTSASAGLKQLVRLEVVNNNLANINTPGFKRQHMVGEVRKFEDTLASLLTDPDPYAKGDHQRTPDVTQVRTVTDFSQGSIKFTGNPLDVALRNPNEFFSVQTPEGEQYTRAGNFTLNDQGQLVTIDGLPVMSDGGPITIDGTGASISSGGGVFANGQEVARLKVVHFDDPGGLKRVGATRFALESGLAAPRVIEDAKLEAQALEMANVSAIQSMVEMISAARGFEMYTKTAKSIDEMNQTAISRIPRD